MFLPALICPSYHLLHFHRPSTAADAFHMSVLPASFSCVIHCCSRQSLSCNVPLAALLHSSLPCLMARPGPHWPDLAALDGPAGVCRHGGTGVGGPGPGHCSRVRAQPSAGGHQCLHGSQATPGAAAAMHSCSRGSGLSVTLMKSACHLVAVSCGAPGWVIANM